MALPPDLHFDGTRTALLIHDLETQLHGDEGVCLRAVGVYTPAPGKAHAVSAALGLDPTPGPPPGWQRERTEDYGCYVEHENSNGSFMLQVVDRSWDSRNLNPQALALAATGDPFVLATRTNCPLSYRLRRSVDRARWDACSQWWSGFCP